MTEVTTTPEIDKQQAFDQWFEALRSGDYKQGSGALCKEVEDGVLEHCCVGVLDEVVFKTSWKHSGHCDDDGKVVMYDQFGEEGNMQESVVAPLDLDKALTAEELATLDSYGVDLGTEDTRISALAMLNDNGADFDTIVMLMEQFGWNNA